MDRAGERISFSVKAGKASANDADGDDGLGGRRPTINDIARLANVSKKTVSRVINDSPFVKEDTRAKVNAIIARYGYAPDPQARGLAFRRSFLIGFVYDNPNPQYVVNMQLGLLDGMRGSGFELVVHPCTRGVPNFLPEVRNFVERQKLYGVVVTPSLSEDEGLAQMLRDVGCAYIRVASVPLDDADKMIVSQDRLGGAEVGRHLGSLGHKRVAFISGVPTFRSSHERRGGFEEGLAEHGVKLAPQYDMAGAYTFESGLACAEKLLALSPRPTAIFAANDEMAAGVLHAARHAGVKVPEELSVVGFDDFQVAERVLPSLTTVHTPTREVGRMAALKLIRAGRETKEPPPPEPDRTVPYLVVRESSGPPGA